MVVLLNLESRAWPMLRNPEVRNTRYLMVVVAVCCDGWQTSQANDVGMPGGKVPIMVKARIRMAYP